MAPCVAYCLCSRVGSVAVAVPAPTICFAPLSIVTLLRGQPSPHLMKWLHGIVQGQLPEHPPPLCCCSSLFLHFSLWHLLLVFTQSWQAAGPLPAPPVQTRPSCGKQMLCVGCCWPLIDSGIDCNCWPKRFVLKAADRIDPMHYHAAAGIQVHSLPETRKDEFSCRGPHVRVVPYNCVSAVIART